jgi:negative regulator of flagellin synthesis FlgM
MSTRPVRSFHVTGRNEYRLRIPVANSAFSRFSSEIDIMHIPGTTHIHGPHGMNAPHAPFRGLGASQAPAAGSTDRVDISPAAEAAVRATESSEVRHDLVNSIRAQIAAGTYETPQKLDAAIERLLDEIG